MKTSSEHQKTGDITGRRDRAGDGPEPFSGTGLPAGLRPALGLSQRCIARAERWSLPAGTRGVLLDLNGTISASEQWYRAALRSAAENLMGTAISNETWAKVLTAWHMTDTAACRHTIRALRRLMPDAPHANINAAQLAREQLRILRAGETTEAPIAVEGMVPLIQAVGRRGIPLAVVTGSAAQEARDTLERFGIGGSIEVIVSTRGLPLGLSKPQPLAYITALRRLGLEHCARSCFALEDSVAGALAAFRAGIDVVLKTDGAPAGEAAAALRARAREECVEHGSAGRIVLVRDWTRIEA